VEPEQFEQIAVFDRELHQAFERKPAPPGLKSRILAARTQRRNERLHYRMVVWQRLAAAVVLVAVLAGGVAWRQVHERRKGEEARRQVFTALRITQRALNQINAQLNARSRADHAQDQGDTE
jgi:hypothetical protein